MFLLIPICSTLPHKRGIYIKGLLCYRLSSAIISEDRKNILKANRDEIKELINLRKAPILDRLHEDRVITLEDKEVIEVRMYINIVNMINKVRVKMIY